MNRARRVIRPTIAYSSCRSLADHFGASEAKFLKRGSFRSGSNIDRAEQRRSERYIFSQRLRSAPRVVSVAAMARSCSPIRAATLARTSIGWHQTRVSLDWIRGMARSVSVNAAPLSPRPILVSARCSTSLRFSACSFRKDCSARLSPVSGRRHDRRRPLPSPKKCSSLLSNPTPGQLGQYFL